MTRSMYAVIVVLTLGGAKAARVTNSGVSESAAEGSLCNLTESQYALGYGIHGLFPVKSCMLDCKWNKFLAETLESKVLSTPEVGEDDVRRCKCKYNPRYWEGGAAGAKFWFSFRISPLHSCTLDGCKKVFFDWGNMFLKKLKYPGDNERMPVAEHLEGQSNYEMKCASGIPEGIVLPSPGSKVTQLRLLIAKTTDPEEKARLQALLDELLGDKVVEVFEYDLDGDWGPEHHADSSSGGDLHSFFLKPCKSNLGKEVTDLHEIQEECGPWEKGVSMKEGKLRYSYKTDEPWGPEQVCDLEDAAKCQMLEEEATSTGFKLLSFRLKPCKTPSGESEVEGLNEILAEEHCGKPTLRESLLPVKVSAARKFDPSAPEDELEFPCP